MNRRLFFNFLIKFLVALYFQNFFVRKSYAKKKEKVLTKVLTNKIFFAHHISPGHPESPERIKYIIEKLKKSNFSELLETPKLNKEVHHWILKIHNEEHINKLKKNFALAEKVSKSAVQICLQGVDQIMQKKTKNIFCAVRPPGHHALNTGKEEGFCYYNHIAITARYIQETYKLKKILIVDWDYHHGNSTEFFFYDDPTVLFFSSHDQYAYPGTGSPSKKGVGKGYGYNINVHLPCKTKDEDIVETYKKILIPAAEKFKPDFILISSGFDSRIDDPLGCYNVTDSGFRELTKIVLKIAIKHCKNRTLSILEGGYNLDGNSDAAIAHIEILNNFN